MRAEVLRATPCTKSLGFATVSWSRAGGRRFKASNFVQNVFFLYHVTGFTQICHSIPVIATKL